MIYFNTEEASWAHVLAWVHGDGLYYIVAPMLNNYRRRTAIRLRKCVSQAFLLEYICDEKNFDHNFESDGETVEIATF